MRLAVKILLGFLALLAAAAGSLVFVLFFRPSWLFNERTLSYAPGLLQKVGVEASWREVALESSTPERWTHRFAWDFRGLCVAVDSVPLDFCAESLIGAVDLGWRLADFPRFLRVTRIGGVFVSGGKLAVGPFAPAPEAEPSTFDPDRIEVPWILAEAVFEPARLSFDRVRVMTDAGALDGPLQVSLRMPEAGRLAISVNDAEAGWAPICWRESVPWSWKAARKDACVQHVSVKAALGLDALGFVRVTQLGPVKVSARDVRLIFGEGGPAEPVRVAPEEPFVMPKLVSGASLEQAEVQVRDTEVRVVIDGVPWTFEGSVEAFASVPKHASLSSVSEIEARVKAKDLCLEIPYADGCLERVDLGATLAKAAGDGGWSLASVERASAASEKMVVILPDGAAEASSGAPVTSAAAEADAFDWRALPFANRDPEHYHVRFGEIVVVPTERGVRQPAVARGKVDLSLAPAPGGSAWLLEATILPSLSQSADPGLAERLRTVELTARAGSGERPLQGPYRGNLRAAAAFSTGERVRLEFDGGQTPEGPLAGTLSASAALPTGESVSVALSGREERAETVVLRGTVTGQGIKGLSASTVTIAGEVSPRATNLALQGKLSLISGLARVVLPSVTPEEACESPPPGPNLDLQAITLSSCKLDLQYADGLPTARLDATCPIGLTALLTAPEAQAHGKAETVTAGITTSLAVVGEAGPKPVWRGAASVGLREVEFKAKPDGFSIAGKVEGDFVAAQDAPAQNPTWSTRGGLDLAIESFAVIVDKLQHTPYAIIAPFNELEGFSKVSVRLRGDSTTRKVELPFEFKAALRSKDQRFNVGAVGAFGLSELGSAVPKKSVTTKVTLDDIALTLPRFSLRERFPMLFPDRRIEVAKCKPEVAVDENPLAYHVEIDTRKTNPVRISTNLTSSVVPISVEGVVLDNSGMRGMIRIEEFGFEVFRRKADVKSVAIGLPAGEEESPTVDGNIEFKYTDIVINIRIRGTTEEPIIAFESTPIRTEREIISILLYGQDAANADDDQLQTADDLSAAFADRMVGLASLYLLATTPIESVRYNPATKSFNAKVRLDSRTSLNLGTTQEADQRVGLRRRLSSTWSVETDLSKDEQTGQAAGTALLEWSKRF